MGYNGLGNKSIRDYIIKTRREEHLARIYKIMSREPGTGDIDNTKPVIIEALSSNPRKIALRKEFNVVIERENKYVFVNIGM